MPRIAVVGSANMDLVARCAALPQPGETVQASSFEKFPGGKGANQAVAAGRLMGEGAAPAAPQVFFVGCVGDDEHGEALRGSLKAAGVDVTQLSAAGEAPTGTALITVDDAGQNSIVVVPGANALVGPEQVSAALGAIGPDVVLVQFEVPDAAVLACAGHGLLVVDPAPARGQGADFMSSIDIITPNETETLALTGIVPLDEFSQRRAAESLLNQGVKGVVIKLGENGVYYTDGKTELRVPAPRVEAVDTTAAGDAFAGALAAFLAEGSDVGTAVTNAVKCASISVTRRGAQASMPTREEAGIPARKPH